MRIQITLLDLILRVHFFGNAKFVFLAIFAIFFRNFHKFEARVHVNPVLVENFGGFVTSNDALNVSRPIFIVLKISDLQNFLKFLYIEF